MQALQKQVGRRIRELREKKGLSQEALAGICNLHRTYVGLIERGERNLTLSTIAVVADGLGVAPAELLSAVDSKAATERVSKTKIPTPANDIAAHITAIRRILLEAKLADEAHYEELDRAALRR